MTTSLNPTNPLDAYKICCGKLNSSNRDQIAVETIISLIKDALDEVRLPEDNQQEAISIIMSQKIIDSKSRVLQKLEEDADANELTWLRIRQAASKGVTADEIAAAIGRELTRGERRIVTLYRTGNITWLNKYFLITAMRIKFDFERRRKRRTAKKLDIIDVDVDAIPDLTAVIENFDPSHSYKYEDVQFNRIMELYQTEGPRNEQANLTDIARIRILWDYIHGDELIAEIAELLDTNASALIRSCRRARERFDRWACSRPDSQEAYDLLRFSLTYLHDRAPLPDWWREMETYRKNVTR